MAMILPRLLPGGKLKTQRSDAAKNQLDQVLLDLCII